MSGEANITRLAIYDEEGAPTTTAPASNSQFAPREVFSISRHVAKTYFLGHHRAALFELKKALANIGLVIECRDSRVPLTSRNRTLDALLGTRDRVIVYTKARLAAPPGRTGTGTWGGREMRDQLARWQSALDTGDAAAHSHGRQPDAVFVDVDDSRSIARLVDVLKARAAASDSILGLRAFIVGLPNAGKSALLNALRVAGMQKDVKVARTGVQPGVTRKLSTPIRIVPATPPPPPSPSPSVTEDSSQQKQQKRKQELDVGEGVFIVDTPGVFHVTVPDHEVMLKMALVGCVKDWVVPATVVADYLLFLLNRHDPALYAHLCAVPTNDVDVFLDAVARRTGRLTKGGLPSIEGAADWVVKQWRGGALGRFCLDDLSPAALAAARTAARAKTDASRSIRQAKRHVKEMRAVVRQARKSARGESG
ncbi:P-loop containing nucleoside triphosphate hydrolase protein [Nemania sp. NC0429]|nr:P-loop containing nucleoside triphosphate hydrolase protein [Nemania sp. NC0429]